ncbi:MAG: leucine-rich repeat protein [Prevotella sp.]|nr:leucine-rich repeat protein [Prevotella sp.]
MKHLNISMILIMLMSMVGKEAFAHDFEEGNLYFNFWRVKDGKSEVELTMRNNTWSNHYWGSIVIPESVEHNGVTYPVTKIGDLAFGDCPGLTDVTIPNSIEQIGSNAFQNCSKLASITIPSSVTSISGNIFIGCTNLSSIIIDEGNTIYDSRDNCNAIIYTYGNSLSYGCKDTTIPNSVTSIAYNAFSGCTNLVSIEIPNSVTSIGSNAFSGCTNLASIEIPNSVTSIGSDAFNGTSWYNNLPDGLIYAGSVAYRYKGTMPDNTNLVINDGVVSIGDNAFSGCSGLVSVIIPNSVTNIGSSAFRSCSGLTSIEIPNSITNIGNYAFENCSNLSSVTFHCPEIGSWFSGISSIKEVIIGDEVTNIGSYAFRSCSGLNSVTIGKSIGTSSSVGYQAFYGCDGLASVTFHCPEIGSWFSGISSIKEVIIGDEVTSIGDWAFHGCSGLTDVFSYTKSVLSIGSVFGEYQNKATLHVPYALYEQYKESEYWKNFGKIVNFEGLYNVIYMVDSEEYKKSVVEYGTAITAEEEPTKEGYTFSGWSEIPETMPANDVTVTGTFTVNKYKLVYQVDGEEYKSSEIEYGTAITAEEEPTKEGYTFSGWSEIPETMPAHDVIITGTFEKDITLGDANGDGVVNVTDIVEIVNYILGHPSAKFDETAADVNNDGVVNVTDIVSVVNIILSDPVAARELLGDDYEDE